jgi:putative PIN family toxin of toxin-antitoxin system
MRVVLDANVFISAAIRPDGPPGQIAGALLSRQAFELVLSTAIITEVEKVLGLPKVRKYLREPDATLRWFVALVLLGDLVEGMTDVSGVCRDPADDAVLAAAIEGRASAIVTGDDDLLALGEYMGIAILTPRAFLGLLGRAPGRP